MAEAAASWVTAGGASGEAGVEAIEGAIAELERVDSLAPAVLELPVSAPGLSADTGSSGGSRGAWVLRDVGQWSDSKKWRHLNPFGTSSDSGSPGTGFLDTAGELHCIGGKSTG